MIFLLLLVGVIVIGSFGVSITSKSTITSTNKPVMLPINPVYHRLDGLDHNVQVRAAPDMIPHADIGAADFFLSNLSDHIW